MENRIKQLEVEISYLKREIDSLKLMLMNQNGHTYNTTTINNNGGVIPLPMYDEDDRDFLDGINPN